MDAARGQGLRLNGGYTVLHIAAASGHTETLEWLLQRSDIVGAASKAVNEATNTEQLRPLHCMVLTGRFSVAGLQSLINAGADISAKYDYHDQREA